MIKIQNRKLYNSLFHDYLSNDTEIHNFLDSPYNVSWDQKIQSLDLSSSRYHKVKQILINQNADLNSEKSKTYREYLSDANSIILITGQQLGLFASPIYTIYKIISTIKLAEELNSKNSEYKFVPVFWLETEDHDFREINHIGLLDKSFIARQIVYGGNDRGKVSLRHYHLEESIQTFIGEIEESLLETEFSGDLFAKLKEYYQPERDWTTAIKLFLADIFSSSGLLFFQPGAEEIKEISIEFFTQLLEEGDKSTETFNAQSNKLNSMGYHNQVKYIAGQSFIHFERDNFQREHLYKEGSDYYFKNSDERLNQTEVVNIIKNNPSAVSSTVVSRPVLQSWLLPVAAYIAGPGEIAYWAQLTGIFELFNLEIPVVYPRISATIIEPKIARYLGKYSLDTETLSNKQTLFIEDYFKHQNESSKDNPFISFNQLLESEATKIEEYLKSLDPTLIDAGVKSLERIKQTLNNLENRVGKAIEQKNGQLTNHLRQIHSSLYPNEIPQERYQSLIYYLNKFGPTFMDRLFSELDVNEFQHQLLYL